MNIKMTLLSDAIFGNGVSVPGEEDISVQCDEYGFPYYRGSTFKGVFREEMENYIRLVGKDDEDAAKMIKDLLGESGNDITDAQIVFSNFELSDWVKAKVLSEFGVNSPTEVRECITNLRTFTAMNNDGVVQEGTLRVARCINKGLTFYSEIEIPNGADDTIIREVLGMVKWIGTMRNRGFGKVVIEEI